MGTSINISVYLTTEELKEYINNEEDINVKVRALVKKEVKK